MDRPGWVLENLPSFAPEVRTATTHTSSFRRPCSRAMISAVMTAVGASNVAGDTPWTSLGPLFLGNLALFHTTQPLPCLRARVFCVERFSPNGRYFSLSEATDGEYSPLLSLNCPRQTFRSTKATPRADFGGNLLFTFWGTTSKKRRFVGESPLYSTPAQLYMIIKQLILYPCCPFVHNGPPSSQFPPRSTPPPNPQKTRTSRREFHKT